MTARTVFLAPLLFALSACGGGSSSSSIPTLPQEHATLSATTVPPCRLQPSTVSPVFSGTPFIANVSGSTTEAWAVGIGSSPYQPLLEHFNGGTWTHVAAPPNISGGATWVRSGLASVTRISSTDAWAGGSYDTPDNVRHPLTLHWDGTKWSKVTNSAEFAKGGDVFSIGASASNNVWEIGQFQMPTAQDFQILVQRWDGTAWHFVGNTGTTHGDPFGLAVFNSANVWFGIETFSGLPYSGYGHWDGTSLITKGLPWLGTQRPGSINSVSASSATDIWFAGSTSNGPYFAHFDGQHISSFLSITPGNAQIQSVAAFRPGYAVAFGGGVGGTGFADVFNGVDRWHPMTSPLPSNQFVFRDQAVPGTTDLWAAVDSTSGSGTFAGLIACPATPPA